MSERYFYIIPKNPLYIPSQEAQTAALELFSHIFVDSEEPRMDVFDTPYFINAGEALEAVICPKCSSKLKITYKATYEDWWRKIENEKMNSNLGLETEQISMPCCNTLVHLFDLKFEQPSGFARFSLDVEPSFEEADVWNEEMLLKQPIVEQFEKILGCEISQVVQWR